MVGVGVPCRRVVVGLIAPDRPTNARPAGEHFQPWAGAAAFDKPVLLIWFSAVFALLGRKNVFLGPTLLQGSGVLAAHTEQKHFCHIAEVESDATPVWPPSLRILYQMMLLL